MPCLVLHQEATPEALAAGFTGRSHITGPDNAPVTIVTFSDFQCPACAVLEASLRQIRAAHPQDVRLVFITTPLAERDKDYLAMQAAEAADLQGKYWEMHDLLFQKQSSWLDLAPAAFESWVAEQASALGLDPVRFKVDFEGSTVKDRLSQAIQASTNQAFTPPALFVNSTSAYTGLIDFANLDQVVRMEILTARQFSACPDWTIDTMKQYIVTLHTSKGDVAIQLFPDKAPLAVNNFVFLVRSGWYDGITFYRVTDQRVETGDPSDTGMGNPGYLFSTEIPAGISFDKAGMVAMENSGMNTNGSRFFINLAPVPDKNGQYTILGQVLTGLDVLNSLARRDPIPGSTIPPGDELISISVEEK